MNSSQQFSDHVYASDLTAWKLECNPLWDRVLGTILILCTLVGTPGNALSLLYFWRSRRMSNLTTHLYMSICCIDICTIISHLPVVVTLFSDRYPGVFNNLFFCAAWAEFFKCLVRISMFLVMLLSVARCISVALPFKRFNPTRFFMAFPVYTVFLVVCDAVVASRSGVDVIYGPDGGECYTWNSDPSKLWLTIDKTLDSIQSGVPPVLCFISFVICLIKLASSGPTVSSRERNKRAAVTVTIFTGIFLVCNLPFFVNKTLQVITISVYSSYPGPLFSGTYMYWYSWTVSKVLFTVLNATLNPVLYYYRIPGLKEWISQLFRDSKEWILNLFR